jgi:hypothetical protein
MGAPNKNFFVPFVFLACFTCYSKADYNLPLFAFAFLLWDLENPSHKARLSYLFAFSWIIDFVWLCYWGPYYNSKLFNRAWSKGVHSFVIVLSVFMLLGKLGLIAFLVWKESEVRKAFSLEGLKENL